MLSDLLAAEPEVELLSLGRLEDEGEERGVLLLPGPALLRPGPHDHSPHEAHHVPAGEGSEQTLK